MNDKKPVKNENMLKENTWRKFWNENALSLTFILGSVIGAITLCYLLSQPQSTPRDNFILSSGLMIMSSWASFLISKMFAEYGVSNTLRDKGTQIAGNIIVLKMQINDLTEWTAQKRNLHRSDLLVDARLEHIQETLLSLSKVNDATLTSVSGIIGGELENHEKLMKQISGVRESASEQIAKILNKMQVVTPSEIPALQTQIDQIKYESEKEVAALAYKTPLPIPAAPLKKIFNDKCPYCHQVNQFEMLDRAGETRPIICRHCQGQFNAHMASGAKVFTRPYGGSSEVRSGGHRASVENGNSEVQSFKLKESLLVNQNWVTDDKKRECKRLLQEMRFWVDPQHISSLCDIVIIHDKKLRELGGNVTPFNLQSAVLADGRETVSNTLVRTFMRILMFGASFHFNEKPNWKTHYNNMLNKERLIEGFITGSVLRICELRPLNPADSEWLSQLLLDGNAPEGLSVIRRILEERAKVG